MHKAAGMHLISTCTGNEVGSSYVLAFGSWITFVSCNALGVTLHIGIGDRTMDNGKQLIILVMMIIDSYQRLKDPYSLLKMCSILCSSSETIEEEGPVGPRCIVPDINAAPGPALGWCSSWLE